MDQDFCATDQMSKKTPQKIDTGAFNGLRSFEQTAALYVVAATLHGYIGQTSASDACFLCHWFVCVSVRRASQKLPGQIHETQWKVGVSLSLKL